MRLLSYIGFWAQQRLQDPSASRGSITRYWYGFRMRFAHVRRALTPTFASCRLWFGVRCPVDSDVACANLLCSFFAVIATLLCRFADTPRQTRFDDLNAYW